MSYHKVHAQLPNQDSSYGGPEEQNSCKIVGTEFQIKMQSPRRNILQHYRTGQFNMRMQQINKRRRSRTAAPHVSRQQCCMHRITNHNFNLQWTKPNILNLKIGLTGLWLIAIAYSKKQSDEITGATTTRQNPL